MLESIKRTLLFRGLTEQECVTASALGQHRTFRKGEVLHYEGSEVETIFLTIDGVIQISRSGPDGSLVILRLARAGDVLGAAEWISRGIHRSLAVAAHASRVLFWREEEFRRMAARHPVLASNALQIAQVQLEELEERFWESMTQKVEFRIARQLIRLLRQSGPTVELNFEQLSLMTGTTIFTVSRVLSRWSAAGLIRRRKGKIEVMAGDALAVLGDSNQTFAAPTSRQDAIMEASLARQRWNEAREKTRAARLELDSLPAADGNYNYKTLLHDEIEALAKYRASMQELKTRRGTV